MRCALISETLDLKSYYGDTFAQMIPQIDLVSHPVTPRRRRSSWRWPGGRRKAPSRAIRI